MSMFTRDLTLPDGHLSTLWTEFQETAAQHMDILHLRAERWPGLMWVVVRQRVVLQEDIPAGRLLTMRSWMEQGRHDMFPRQYVLQDGERLLCRAAAVWALVDVESRTFGKAPREMYDAPVRVEEGQLPRLTMLRSPKAGQCAGFTVTADTIDENGHMNNARYFDAVEAVLPTPVGALREAQVDYISEALLGEEVTLLWHEENGVHTISGEKDGRACFRMRLVYQ